LDILYSITGLILKRSFCVQIKKVASNGFDTTLSSQKTNYQLN